MPKGNEPKLPDCIWCGNVADHELTCRDCDMQRCDFACQAMVPMMEAPRPEPASQESLESWREHIAFRAFEMANATMEERRRRL